MEKKVTSNYLLLNKSKDNDKYQLIKGFKIQIQELKKEKIILDIGNLIENINKKNIIMGLFSLEKFKKEALIFSNKELNKVIDKIAKELLKINSIIFKLELYKPKFHLLEIEELIVWIYKVNIKQEKLKTDNKKQFFYLIYQYQQEENLEKKQILLLEILKKIQKHIKYAK